MITSSSASAGSISIFTFMGFPLRGVPPFFAVDNSDYTDTLSGVNRLGAGGGKWGIRGEKREAVVFQVLSAPAWYKMGI